MVPTHQLHGFGDITVVTYHNATVIGIEPAVIQQVYGKIDIRAFLFCLDHFSSALRAHRLSEQSPDSVS